MERVIGQLSGPGLASCELSAAKHFTAVDAARWEVELLFRELKGSYRLGQMPSANRRVHE